MMRFGGRSLSAGETPVRRARRGKRIVRCKVPDHAVVSAHAAFRRRTPSRSRHIMPHSRPPAKPTLQNLARADFLKAAFLDRRLTASYEILEPNGRVKPLRIVEQCERDPPFAAAEKTTSVTGDDPQAVSNRKIPIDLTKPRSTTHVRRQRSDETEPPGIRFFRVSVQNAISRTPDRPPTSQ